MQNQAPPQGDGTGAPQRSPKAGERAPRTAAGDKVRPLNVKLHQTRARQQSCGLIRLL